MAHFARTWVESVTFNPYILANVKNLPYLVERVKLNYIPSYLRLHVSPLRLSKFLEENFNAHNYQLSFLLSYIYEIFPLQEIIRMKYKMSGHPPYFILAPHLNSLIIRLYQFN